MVTDTVYPTKQKVQSGTNQTNQQNTLAENNSPKRQHELTIRQKSKAHKARQNRLTSLSGRLIG